MTAITWADVLALPNLPASFTTPGVSVGAQTAILHYVNGDAQGGLDANAYGGEGDATLDLARRYCAAHLALVGPLAAIKTGTREDDLADTYALMPIPPGASFWFTTRYGMAFWQMTVSSPDCRLGFVT